MLFVWEGLKLLRVLIYMPNENFMDFYFTKLVAKCFSFMYSIIPLYIIKVIKHTKWVFANCKSSILKQIKTFKIAKKSAKLTLC